ncbi:defective in cullin neddylation protein AAR3 [Amaranthus tricolor]|uniref:defective in cullin neddylation protein AAR3 n=1 Tax=Amaranthus tricolor TaxID=29722 RepID=UPI00258805CC|nr:defective in cullin neddylation protein AAR3 [Amaranthus tricolor]
MEYSNSTQFDIFQIYRKFRDIRSGDAYRCQEMNMLNDELENTKSSREAMYKLTKMVDSSIMSMSLSILDELHTLMSRLNLREDFSEFSYFYDFVFFMCRENGQKNITVSRAIDAWKLILSGRFRLLNQWCDFVVQNQRYNISEDTWRQVLVFSRCVHEDLAGYDLEGAWPTLIDDFVEHMYRITGSNNCSSHNREGESSIFKESFFPGLKNVPGFKRKIRLDLQQNYLDTSSSLKLGRIDSITSCKRRKPLEHRFVGCIGNTHA